MFIQERAPGQAFTYSKLRIEILKLTEGLLHNIGSCFDIMFAGLEISPKTRNKFAEIVAVVERYLVITHVKNKESKKQPFRICLSVILYLIYLS